MNAYSLLGKKGNLELIFGNKDRNQLIQAIKEMKDDESYEVMFLNKIEEEEDIDIIYFIIHCLYNNYIENEASLHNSELASYYFNLLFKIFISLFYVNEKSKAFIENNMNFIKFFLCIFIIALKKQIDKINDYFELFLKTYCVTNINEDYIISLVQSEIKENQLKDKLLLLIKEKYNEHKNKNNTTVGDFLYRELTKNIQCNIPVPNHLKISEPSKLINISENGLNAYYISKENLCLTLRTDIPIPNSVGLYYFEVEIIHIGDTIGIGFINKDFNLQNKIPGWESNSIGYHSDDGLLYLCNSNGEKYGPVYTTGDFIGCCINTIEKYFFFTKNGEKLKQISYKDDMIINSSIEYYPAIGMRKHKQEIRCNFGQSKFFFDFEAYRREVLNKYYKEIIGKNIEKIITTNEYELYLNGKTKENLILDYLLYCGYEETHKELSKAVIGKGAKYLCDCKIGIRNSIKVLLQEHKFEEAQAIIVKNFSRNENALTYVNFYHCLMNIYTNFKTETNNIYSFIKEIKDKIIFNDKNRVIYNSIYKDEIDNLLSVALSSGNPSKNIKDYLIVVFSYEEMFTKINSELLADNYSLYGNEIEKILKQLLLCINNLLKTSEQDSKSQDREVSINKEKLCLLLRDKEFIPTLNGMLVQRNLSCDEIKITNSIRDYFEQINLNK